MDQDTELTRRIEEYILARVRAGLTAACADLLDADEDAAEKPAPEAPDAPAEPEPPRRSRRDARAARPRLAVSGSFLSDLWLGLAQDADVHPSGIRLHGWRIEGAIDLHGAKRSREGHDGLPPLVIEDCLCGTIDLARARIADLTCRDCTVSGIDLDESETLGTVSLVDCDIDWLQCLDARLGGDLRIYGGRVARNLALRGARIRGDLLFYDTRVDAHGVDGALNGLNLRVEGLIQFVRCSFRDTARLEGVKASSVELHDVRIHAAGPTALLLESMRSEGALTLQRVRLGGALDASFAMIRGRTTLGRVRTTHGAGLRFASAVLEQEMIVEDCRTGDLDLFEARLEHGLSISDTAFYAVPNAEGERVRGLLFARRCRMGELRVSRSSFERGAWLAGAAVSGEVELVEVALGWSRRRGDPATADGAGTALDLSDARIDGSLSVSDAFLCGQAQLAFLTVGARVALDRVMIIARPTIWSLLMEGMGIRSVLKLRHLWTNTGVAMPTLRCSELQIGGCAIGLPRQGTEALWASDCTIDRRLVFEPRPEATNRFRGTINFSNSKIGEAAMFRAIDARLSGDPGQGAPATVLSLNGCKVGGDVHLFDYRHEHGIALDPIGDVPRFDGCVDLDRAEIDGAVEIHRTVFNAVGSLPGDPSPFEREDLIARRKIGVALSMRGTRIRRELAIGIPRIGGIVDLRDADVRRIADGAGFRWRIAGLRGGDLLLDGLCYRDFDELIDDSVSAQSWLLRGGGIAQHRLAWLKLQFPGGVADRSCFVPQPYEQLAKVLGEEGDERARRRVVVAKRRLQQEHGGSGRADRMVNRMLRVTSQYGYDPGLAAAWLAVYLLFGTFLAEVLWLAGLLVPNGDMPAGVAFNPLVYAIDAAIPVVDLKQDGAFMIAGLERLWLLEATAMIGKAAYQLVGLGLASITILTLTGVLREKE